MRPILNPLIQAPKSPDSGTVSPHILYDFYIGNEAAREEAELKEAARYQMSLQSSVLVGSGNLDKFS